MNTVDAIADLGGRCTNFLDMGGKATSETVKQSFILVLSNPRVKTIFVNIFGGLTLCDMIAQGIMMAYEEIGVKVPVVVRLRGTNEQAGQKMVSKIPFRGFMVVELAIREIDTILQIAESGLALHAYDDFDEAARKAIELASL